MPGNASNLTYEGGYCYAYVKNGVGILCSDKNLTKVEWVYFPGTHKYDKFNPHNPLHKNLVVNPVDRR